MVVVSALDWEQPLNEILSFIKKTIADAGAKGSVIGLSGGIDSSLVAKLLVVALGKESVLGISMPTSFTPKTDIEDAKWLADYLQIKFIQVGIQNIADSFVQALGIPENHKNKIPMANIRSRTRMIILYYHANLNNYLVAGTGDRSEDLIGYFTKYGDGGVDFLPISHLYKHQVRGLAEYLGLPERIFNKPSSPQLYPGHKATDEIPLDYDRLDQVLRMLFDEKKSPAEVAQQTSISQTKIDEVLQRFSTTGHKRAYPPMVRSW